MDAYLAAPRPHSRFYAPASFSRTTYNGVRWRSSFKPLVAHRSLTLRVRASFALRFRYHKFGMDLRRALDRLGALVATVADRIVGSASTWRFALKIIADEHLARIA